MGVDPTVSRSEIGSATQLSQGTGYANQPARPVGVPISMIVQLHRLIDLRHYSRSIISSPAGEQQTPRLFKDWVSVSAGTQITNCSSHTFLRPRPGWRQLVRRTSIFHLTQRSLILGSAMSSIAGLHSCIASHKCP